MHIFQYQYTPNKRFVIINEIKNFIRNQCCRPVFDEKRKQLMRLLFCLWEEKNMSSRNNKTETILSQSALNVSNLKAKYYHRQDRSMHIIHKWDVVNFKELPNLKLLCMGTNI